MLVRPRRLLQAAVLASLAFWTLAFLGWSPYRARSSLSPSPSYVLSLKDGDAVFARAWYRDAATATLDLGGGAWAVRNGNGSVTAAASVPGGIYSDLERDGRIKGDVYYRFNDVDYRWIAHEDWTFSRTFNVSEAQLGAFEHVVLHFEGLDTAAKVVLNSKEVGAGENMFVRYRFDVKSHLKWDEPNLLEVRFESPTKYALRKAEAHTKERYSVPPECPPSTFRGECHMNFIRKIQSSFGWDVGPSYPSSGIWRPVFLEAFDAASIQYIKFFSERPSESVWKVRVEAVVEVRLAEGLKYSAVLSDTRGNAVLELDSFKIANADTPTLIKISFEGKVSAESVRVWWPNEMGEQALYSLRVRVTTGSRVVSDKAVAVGFRTVELVQEHMANVTGDAEANGRTFYLSVNGVPVFLKGANLVPIHMLPEKVTKKMVDELLYAAKSTHMNMIRIWGGGMYESDYLYSKADQLGIMIWQDFIFACSLYPATEEFLSNVRQEALHQVRRLQHHASVVLFEGNNENSEAINNGWWMILKEHREDYRLLNDVTLRGVVESEAPTTLWHPSGPSNGPVVNVSDAPGSYFYGDIHYYNREMNQWHPRIYPIPRMVTEYGFQSYISLSTLAKYMQKEDLYWPSRAVEHHQHGSNGANSKMVFTASFHFDTDHLMHDRSQDGLGYLIYVAQINHAEALRIATEHYRRWRNRYTKNFRGMTMGTLYWQLNSMWPGADLASIEYGGKWKVATHFTERFYRPLMISVDEPQPDKLSVYVINDHAREQTGLSIALHVHKYEDLSPCAIDTFHLDAVKKLSAQLVLKLNISDILDKCSFEGLKGADSKSTSSAAKQESMANELIAPDFLGNSYPGGDNDPPKDVRRRASFFTLSLRDASGSVVSETHKLLSEPKHALTLRNPELKVSFVNAVDDGRTFEIGLTANKVAIFVYIDTELAGRLSDNGFFVTGGEWRVRFFAEAKHTPKAVQESLKVYTYFQNK